MPEAPPTKTVLETILEWSTSGGVPAWQRDALRRIVQSGPPTDADIAELVQLCKRGRMATRSAEGSEPDPLALHHLPANPGQGKAIALTAISNPVAVNTLAADQVLEFAAEGLTVVYGNNAVGKSGYARILKRACRARHSEKILPNAFGGSPAPASAILSYRQDGQQEPPIAWQDADNIHPHPVLSAVSVFDANCAVVHLKTKNDVAFRPFGLDVPDDLVDACKKVKAVLEAEKQRLDGARHAALSLTTWKPTTVTGKTILNLSADTSPARLDQLAALTPDEEDRLKTLTADLARDPQTAAREQRLWADRLATLRKALAGIAAGTSDQALAQMLALHSAATTKREAARLAATLAFGTAPLKGVGDDAWRDLWTAARRYATQSAQQVSFPPPAAGDPCALCQQPLTPEALDRMRGFDCFVQADTEQQAQDANQKLMDALDGLTALQIRLKPIADTLRELALHKPALAATIRRALAAARLRRWTLREQLAEAPNALLPAEIPFPLDALGQAETAAGRYAAELGAPGASQARHALEQEREELADRVLLRQHLIPVALGFDPCPGSGSD